MTIAVVSAFAQTDQQQIDDQVWKPFTKAITERDPEAFMAVHSKDVIRVVRDGKEVKNYESYKKGMVENWPKYRTYVKENNLKVDFELRFLERHSNGNEAFEVGYYKSETIKPNGEKRTSYGQFHVALRKENGVWKILVDSDSSNGGTITEEMFAAASPIE
jgi:ketosteroid isomerase-like protein